MQRLWVCAGALLGFGTVAMAAAAGLAGLHASSGGASLLARRRTQPCGFTAAGLPVLQVVTFGGFAELQRAAMARDVSWDGCARHYLDLYREMLQGSR